MEQLTDSQRRRRQQVETVIAVAAPALELILAAGEKLSRLAEPRDYEYYPVRSPEDRDSEQSYEAPGGSESSANNVRVLRPRRQA